MKALRTITAAVAAATLCLSVHASETSRGEVRVLAPEDIRSIEGLLGGTIQGSGIVRLTPANFSATAGQITFSEFAVGTVNPTYLPANYGGGAASPTVTFDGFFAGQAIGTIATCPPGAAVSGCVVGMPTNPLALDPASPATSIVNDGANPTSPVLSGTPTFNGPIAILFSTDQAAVGLDGGFFDAIGGTAITAFRRDGSLIGSVSNEGLGIEFLGLGTADGTESIAGLLFSLVGSEPAGFGIDNLRFALAGQVIGLQPPVPVPTNHPFGLILLMLGLGLGGLVVLRNR